MIRKLCWRKTVRLNVPGYMRRPPEPFKPTTRSSRPSLALKTLLSVVDKDEGDWSKNLSLGIGQSFCKISAAPAKLGPTLIAPLAWSSLRSSKRRSYSSRKTIHFEEYIHRKNAF